MKKISEDLKTCNKYKPDESSEEYRGRVLKLIASMPGKSNDTIKYLKESFDLKLFEKLLNQKHTDRGEMEMANILAQSCYYEQELADEIMEGSDDFIESYTLRDGLIYNSFFPKLDKKISYTPIYSCYTYSHSLAEGFFHKLDLLKIKGSKNSYIIESGFIRNTRHFSSVIKKLPNKISENLISEGLRHMKEEIVAPGAVAINGSLKWNLNKIFKSIGADSHKPMDPNLIEDCYMLFISKNQKAYEDELFRALLDIHRGILTDGSIWDKEKIDDTRESIKLNKKFLKYFKKLFKKNYYLYNYKDKKWGKSDLFG